MRHHAAAMDFFASLIAFGLAPVATCALWSVVFFFQAEDGIRDLTVTGVQTCALPIWRHLRGPYAVWSGWALVRDRRRPRRTRADRRSNGPQPFAEPAEPHRQSAAIARRRERAERQSVCRTRRCAAGGLHVRPPSPLRPRLPSGQRRSLGARI